MTLIQTTLIALLCFGIGLMSGFFGYPLLRFLLPIWAFLAGMGTVFQLVATGFVGWIIGIAAGLVAATLAYLFFRVGLAIVGAAFGASLSSTLVAVMGLSPGPFSLSISLSIALICAVAAIALKKYFVITATALAGATGMLTALLLILPTGFTINQIELGGPIDPLMESSVFGAIFWLCVSAGGIFYQHRTAHKVDVFEDFEEELMM